VITVDLRVLVACFAVVAIFFLAVGSAFTLLVRIDVYCPRCKSYREWNFEREREAKKLAKNKSEDPAK
jgi:hypothetical protein